MGYPFRLWNGVLSLRNASNNQTHTLSKQFLAPPKPNPARNFNPQKNLSANPSNMAWYILIQLSHNQYQQTPLPHKQSRQQISLTKKSLHAKHIVHLDIFLSDCGNKQSSQYASIWLAASISLGPSTSSSAHLDGTMISEFHD